MTAVSAHGYGPYSNGCRCAVCREAARLYRRENRSKRLAAGTAVHGTRTAYDCGCRCELCKDARRSAYRRLEVSA